MTPEKIGIILFGIVVAVVALRAAVGCLVRLIVIGAVIAALAYVFLL